MFKKIFKVLRASGEKGHRSETTLALSLLALISFLALAGILVFVFQERGRIRIVAEYRAFQLASELLQTYDRGDVGVAEKVEGVVAFGIYTLRGEAIYQYGGAPDQIKPGDTVLTTQISGDTITLIRPLGGFSTGRGRMRPQWNDNSGMSMNFYGMMGGPPVPGGPQGAPGFPGTGRLVYISYRISSLRRGEYALYGGALLMAAALILAFWNLLRLARNLDTYRAQEARNRELVALGEVARTLSHEIKNPLGVLKIQSALLKKNSDPSILPNARIIDEEVDRLGLLTDRVRQYLSTTGGTASVFSLSDYLRSFAPRYGDRVVLQALPEDKLMVQVDRDRLGQVLDNLVSNAFESLDQTAASPVEISAVPVHPDRVEIRVADRGKGIPEAVGERVFDLFYTTKTTGSGLGLSLARRYTELSGGKLSYRNREGGGTVFVVELPVHNGGKTL